MDDASNQLYLFIKENKKVRKQENTLSTKKAIKKKRKERKHAPDQESDLKENIKLSFFLDSRFLGVFFFSFFLISCFLL